MAVRETAKRRHALAEHLLQNGSIQITEFAKRYNVSRETIRKDLIFLEEEGIGKRSRGGSLFVDNAPEVPLTARALENVDHKIQIAKAALKLIPREGTVIHVRLWKYHIRICPTVKT